MTRNRQLILAAVVLALAIAGVAWVFNMRIASGDVYPAYSSLRADALGTRALHDALAEIPDYEVLREYRPVTRWQDVGRSVYLVVGAHWWRWSETRQEYFDVLNGLANRGARVVIAFRAPKVVYLDSDASENSPTTEKAEEKSETESESGEKKSSAKEDEKSKPKNLPPGIKPVVVRKMEEVWGVQVQQKASISDPVQAVDAEKAVRLPETMRWWSNLYFQLPEESPWKIVYRRGDLPVLIEKRVGAGEIVLMAESYPLSNEAVQKERATGLLGWLLGDHHRVVFAESELGVLAENGIAALARRYGLGGAMALGLLVAALYAWRRLMEFVPRDLEARHQAETALAYEPATGMIGLLKRAVPAKQVLEACMAEWRKSKLVGGKRPADERVETAWREAGEAGKKSIANTYNALVRARKPR